ncbi:MAG: carboxypeptidase regulatory-like domain-containing protein [Acidobacteria bacterium]|nr:carboxypeptidase regulatory-like domain-containing protein [Acidobacteriota bacterium]
MKKLAVFLLLASGLAGVGRSEESGVLKIVVLEGDGAFNNMKKRIGRDPVVEVRDEKDHPVAGAKVVFTLPPDGPSATFDGGGRVFRATTDERGRAATKGLKPNSTEGRYKIAVTASWSSRSGYAAISQSNTLAGGAIILKNGGKE